MIDVEKATEEFGQRLKSGYFVEADEQLSDTMDKYPKGLKDEFPLSQKEINNLLKALQNDDLTKKVHDMLPNYKAGYEQGYQEAKTEFYENRYQEGLQDAWELTWEIINMSFSQRKEIFGYNLIDRITASEALEKIKAYKQEHRLEVGDVVVHKGITECKPRVITKIGAEWVGVLSENGYQYEWHKEKVVKTGKHYDIQSILDGLKEDS